MKIVKVPFSGGSMGRNLGCEKAPDAILDELGIVNAVEIKLKNEDLNELSKLENIDGDIFLGGDHSISYWTIKNFVKKYKNPGVIIFDAHFDCENYFKPPSHEDFIKVLVKDNVINKENLIFIGVRRWSKDEIKFIETNKIKYFIADVVNKDLSLVIEELNKLISKVDAIYLSIDIDVLDSKYAPGTGYPEKDGISGKKLFKLSNRLKLSNKIKAIDLVEVNPDKDVNGKTIKIASQIINGFL